MPASLYRLAGKPHHTEVSSVAPPPVEVKEAVQPAADPIVPDPTPTVEDTIAIEAPAELPANDPTPEVQQEEASNDSSDQQADNVVEPEPSIEQPTVPAWDPSWTKAQLLDVALQLKLEVTSLNTKNQIIQALTAATSA